MSIQISNRRNQIRRSTTSSIIPTIPNSATTSSIYPDETWNNTDIMVGELFMNTADSRIWFRDDVGIHELGYSGQTGNFLSLSDTPNSFTPGQWLMVNSTGTALEYTSGLTNTNTIVSQEDFYTVVNSGDTGKSLVYDWDITGFTLETINNDFLSLSDTPSSYRTANYLLKVNSSLNSLEFFDGATEYVDLTTTQSISGEKTFSDNIHFENNILVDGTINLSGYSGLFSISDIETNTAFTNVNDTTLATTKAIYNFVIDTFYGSGTTGTFVDLVSSQTITGEKTFNGGLIANNLTGTSIYSTNNYTNELDLDTSGNIYFGDSSTDGSYRMFINPDGDLEIQKRESGVWTYKANF